MCRSPLLRSALTRRDLVVGVWGFLFFAILASFYLEKVNAEAQTRLRMDRLRRLGLALLCCADERSQGDVPPTWTPLDRSLTRHFHPSSSLLRNLIPYVEQASLIEHVNRSLGSATVHPYYQGPGDPSLNLSLALTSYGANRLFFGDPDGDYGSWWYNGSTGQGPREQAYPRLPLLSQRGAGTVVLLAERYAITGVGEQAIPHFWAEPNISYLPTDTLGFELAPARNKATDHLPQGFTSDGMYVVLGDGSVRKITSKVSPKVWLWANDFRFHSETPADWPDR